MSSQRDSHSAPRTIIHHLPWKERLCRYDKIMNLEKGRAVVLNYLRESNGRTRVLKHGRERQRFRVRGAGRGSTAGFTGGGRGCKPKTRGSVKIPEDGSRPRTSARNAALMRFDAGLVRPTCSY